MSSSLYVPTPNINETRPDLVLKSSDSVLFHVHAEALASASFYLSGASSTVAVPEDSQILTIILDIIYRLPSTTVDFPFAKFIEALRSLPLYGINLEAQLGLGPQGHASVSDSVHPMLQTLHAHAAAAPAHALQLYIFAAQHNMEALAVATSAYLVGFHLTDLTDDDAEAMGTRYLRRLLLLQMRREETLKKILLQPPYPHPSTPDCDVLDQKMLTRAWALSAAYFAWDLRADLPPAALENLLGPLAGHVSCELCKRSIRVQVTKIVDEWKAVKGTI